MLQNRASVISQRAMGAVMAKQRQAWLDCFADTCVIRDPVGGSPLDPTGRGLHGQQGLAKLWDMVIEPLRSVRFDVREEHPSGNSTAKVATVHLTLPSGHTLEYPGVFVYEVDQDGRIEKLSGYFQPPALGDAPVFSETIG